MEVVSTEEGLTDHNIRKFVKGKLICLTLKRSEGRKRGRKGVKKILRLRKTVLKDDFVYLDIRNLR